MLEVPSQSIELCLLPTHLLPSSPQKRWTQWNDLENVLSLVA